MSEWQPIETAPKDGTPMDVWVRRFVVGEAGALSITDVGRYPDVYWAEQEEVYVNPYERRTGKPGWLYKDGLSMLLIETGDSRVTHWMPLPEPPPQ